jgi:hypothetical protein
MRRTHTSALLFIMTLASASAGAQVATGGSQSGAQGQGGASQTVTPAQPAQATPSTTSPTGAPRAWRRDACPTTADVSPALGADASKATGACNATLTTDPCSDSERCYAVDACAEQPVGCDSVAANAIARVHVLANLTLVFDHAANGRADNAERSAERAHARSVAHASGRD